MLQRMDKIKQEVSKKIKKKKINLTFSPHQSFLCAFHLMLFKNLNIFLTFELKKINTKKNRHDNLYTLFKIKTLPYSTVPVRKQKGITSVLLSSFANKENNKIERLTFDSNSRNAKTNANNDFYIGNVLFYIIKKKIKLFFFS